VAEVNSLTGLMGLCCSPSDREGIVLAFGFCGGGLIVGVVEAAAEMEVGSAKKTRTTEPYT